MLLKTQCEVCNKEFERTLKNIDLCKSTYGRNLCRGCMLREQYKKGLRDNQKIATRAACMKNQLGKTFEERLGDRKAKLAKEKLSKPYCEKFSKEVEIEIKNKLSKASSGSNNANFGGKYCRGFGHSKGQPSTKGKSLKEIYGEEKALRIKEKMSNATTGKNNPMYGKPSPIGSGNGWSGWYKNWYFRSLLELSFMINYIEKQNLQWDSGERAKYNISYIDWEGKERSYFPDFILEKNRMIEIKPTNLRNSKNVLLKENAAITWCNEHNFEYQIIESNNIQKLNKEEIKQLYDLGVIKFIDRYEEKYKNG